MNIHSKGCVYERPRARSKISPYVLSYIYIHILVPTRWNEKIETSNLQKVRTCIYKHTYTVFCSPRRLIRTVAYTGQEVPSQDRPASGAHTHACSASKGLKNSDVYAFLYRRIGLYARYVDVHTHISLGASTAIRYTPKPNTYTHSWYKLWVQYYVVDGCNENALYLPTDPLRQERNTLAHHILITTCTLLRQGLLNFTRYACTYAFQASKKHSLGCSLA